MAKSGTAEVLTGAVVLLIAAVFLGFAVAHSGRTISAGYKLHAQFDHVDGLNPGADVRIAGVKIGSVIDMRIDPKSFLADVTMTVHDDIRLPKDTAVEVTSESLLGGKFLNLSPGGSDTNLAPGGLITITQSSISLEQLLGKFIFSATNLTDKANTDKTATDKGGTDKGGTDKGGAGNGAPK